MITIDFEKYAEKFGVTVERMTEKGTELLKKIESIEEFAKKDDDYKLDLFDKAIGGQIFSNSFKSGLEYAKENGKEYEGIVLGMGIGQDENRFEIKKCRDEYKVSSIEAIKKRYMARVRIYVDTPEELVDMESEEYVFVKSTGTLWRCIEVDDDKWIDTKYKDKRFEEGDPVEIPLWHAKTKKDSDEPNPMYGMPIKKRYEKRAFFWMDDQLWLAKGDIGITHKVFDKEGNDTGKVTGVMPVIGSSCSFWGRKYGGIKNQAYVGTINVMREGYEPGTAVDEKKLWELAGKLSEITYKKKDKKTGEETNETLYRDLCDIEDMPNYGYFVTHGTIRRAELTGDYNRILLTVFDDDCPKGVNLSVNYEPMIPTIEGLSEGDEVVVVGERSSYKSKDVDADGRSIWKPQNVLMGVFKNPTNTMSDDIAKLHEMLK